MQKINLRFDLLFSYWIFIWFLLYFIALLTQPSKIINKIPNPFWILVVGAIFTSVININGIFKFIKLQKQQQNNNNEIKQRKIILITFTIINIIIKLLPIVLLIIYKKYKLKIYDVIFTLGLFIVYTVHRGIINDKPMYWNKQYYEKYDKYGIDPTTPIVSIINSIKL